MKTQRRRISQKGELICISNPEERRTQFCTRKEDRKQESSCFLALSTPNPKSDWVITSVWGKRTRVTRKEFEQYYKPYGYPELN